MNYLKRKYNLLIGERTAEQIKMEIGSAYPLDKPLQMEIKGRNLIEGVPKTITIDDAEIRESLSECVATIMNAIRVALERTPPELSADIVDKGVVLSGGGAQLKNLDVLVREETGLPVMVCDGVHGVEEFVVDGYNGWSIARTHEAIAGWLARVLVERASLPRMGRAAAESERPDTYAEAQNELAETQRQRIQIARQVGFAECSRKIAKQ